MAHLLLISRGLSNMQLDCGLHSWLLQIGPNENIILSTVAFRNLDHDFNLHMLVIRGLKKTVQTVQVGCNGVKQDILISGLRIRSKSCLSDGVKRENDCTGFLAWVAFSI
jgi:hypothetical protein